MSTKRRRRGGRGKLGFVYSLLVLLTMIIVLSISVGLFFKISAVEVVGTEVYTVDEVRKTAEFNIGDNIFFINKYAAIRRIFEKLPYVSQVRVQRKLPGTIVIHITEVVTVGAIEHQGYYWLFDSNGKLLRTIAAAQKPGYPVVKGVSLLSPVIGQNIVFSVENKEKERRVPEILSALHSAGIISDVSELDVSNISDVRFLYKNMYTVKLGMPDDLTYKLNFLGAAVKELDPSEKGVLDLTLAKDKVLRFIPES